jgi:hypothetical protein
MLAELTRRKFIGLLSAVNLMLGGKGLAAEDVKQVQRLPIHDLHLRPDELRDLEAYATPVVEAARALDELDLGNLPVSLAEPALLFEPGRFYRTSRSEHATAKTNDTGKSDE